ncbi:VOC family protein [Streptomyces olivaceus]|uniref:VOC family protein n=1 Tax=Streptomyces TaxID=1883 RepID=UPI0022EDA6EA|nr:hypothetical protein TPA0906_12380 [Streptomyces olivaceus]
MLSGGPTLCAGPISPSRQNPQKAVDDESGYSADRSPGTEQCHSREAVEVHCLRGEGECEHEKYDSDYYHSHCVPFRFPQSIIRWLPCIRPQQQMHLDFGVDDLATADRRATDAGATRLRPTDEVTAEIHTGSRVYASPAGHPFCLRTT